MLLVVCTVPVELILVHDWIIQYPRAVTRVERGVVFNIAQLAGRITLISSHFTASRVNNSNIRTV